MSARRLPKAERARLVEEAAGECSCGGLFPPHLNEGRQIVPPWRYQCTPCRAKGLLKWARTGKAPEEGFTP